MRERETTNESGGKVFEITFFRVQSGKVRIRALHPEAAEGWVHDPDNMEDLDNYVDRAQLSTDWGLDHKDTEADVDLFEEE